MRFQFGNKINRKWLPVAFTTWQIKNLFNGSDNSLITSKDFNPFPIAWPSPYNAVFSHFGFQSWQYNICSLRVDIFNNPSPNSLFNQHRSKLFFLSFFIQPFQVNFIKIGHHPLSVHAIVNVTSTALNLFKIAPEETSSKCFLNFGRRVIGSTHPYANTF